jgi:hypothetical protein
MSDTPSQVELVEQLYDENKALKERIKRLEEAGQAMAQELVRRELRSEIDGWIAAKEAKP